MSDYKEPPCPKCGSMHLGGLMESFWVPLKPDGSPEANWEEMSAETEAGQERICYDCDWSSMDEKTSPLDTLLAMLKPLVWKDEAPHFSCAGNDSFRYSVRQTETAFFWMVRGGGGKLGGTTCDSIDHGKELRQQDYQSRVRALFE